MARELLLPELAESVVEGEILKWLVDEGDAIAQDQPIVEVMTDKVTVELPSPFVGTLEKKLVKEGDVVAVHAPIALFADEAGAGSPAKEVEQVVPPSNTQVNTAVGAASGENVQQLVVDVQPERNNNAAVAPSALGADMSATESAVSSNFGAPTEQQRINFGNAARKPQGQTVDAGAKAATNRFGRVLAVPAARKLARDNGLDIADVPGSGPNGRVRVADVRAFVENASAPPAPASTQPTAESAPAPRPAPAPGGFGGFPGPVAYRTPKGYEALEERVPLRGLRRAISNQMLASHLHTVRTLTVDEVDLTQLVGVRSRAKAAAERQGVKLTYLPFIVKAAAAALKAHPTVNSSLDDARQEVVLKRYYNVGIAVATDAGLIVPVVRDVDRKSILETARDIGDLAVKARDGKLSPEEMAGSTFSVTNIGSVGALFSFPIINVPDAAILGVHSLLERPVVRDGQIVVRSMMYLSMSFDHRLVDGADAARFTKTLIRLLEDPETLLLEGI